MTNSGKTLVALALGLCVPAAGATAARAADENEQQQVTPVTESQNKQGIRVTFYPVMVKAPIFGASINLPPLPTLPPGGGGGGGETGDLSGSTDLSLNAAYMGGILVEADRWFAEFNALLAGLEADHTLPRVHVHSKIQAFNGRAGLRLIDGLSATVGFRRQTLDLDATLVVPDTGNTIEGHVKPGIWDPLIGVDWRHRGGRLGLDANFQGGGFGVGNDVDLSGEGHVGLLLFRHVELRAGFTVYHFKLTVANVNIGAFQRELGTTQTLYGPEIAFGIVF